MGGFLFPFFLLLFFFLIFFRLFCWVVRALYSWIWPLFGCAGTDCISLSITLSACPIIAPRVMTECGFIVTNVVKSLRLCLRVVTSTDPMHQSRNLDRYTIL